MATLQTTRIVNVSHGAGNSISALVVWTAAVLVGTAAGLAAVLALVGVSPDTWRGLLAATIASSLATAASLLPLGWSMQRGMTYRVAGYFIAAGLRAMVSLAACIVAIKAGGYPAVSTLLLMVVFYFAVLTVETTLVARGLWDARQD
jgi:hypothetical protein